MAAANGSKLYSPRLLSLSAQLADFPLLSDLPLMADVRSRTCGSTLKLGLEVDEAGVIRRIGMQVSACAVGQSSAAVLAQAAIGKNAEDIAATKSAIESWLEADAPLPDWPGFDALEPAQPHAGRHGALLLPWTAAMEALCSQAASG